MISSTIMLLLILFAISFSVAVSFPGEKDEVAILPGLRIQPTFKHYSGYLNGSATRRLHYWFVTSQNNAATDPLVLWMNGGPGCSSLDGLLNEHGPFRLQSGGFLEYNRYSWNRIANIIYLESPACVGFSYSTDGKCDAGDDSTSLLNYKALNEFLVKFPQYEGRDFYITGESYGGFYVPSLAERIIDSKDVTPLRFKGIAVGNGLSSWSYNDNGNFHFAYNHGLISDRMMSDIIATCCHNVDPIHCNITGNKDPICQYKVTQAMLEFININVYNIYSPCVTASVNSDHDLWSRLNVNSNYEKFKITFGWNTANDKRLGDLREQFKILTAFPQLLNKSDSVSLQIPCVDSSTTDKYLNSPRVRYALHIPEGLPPWDICSAQVNLHFDTNYINMSRQYNTMFKLPNFRIWIYNGDIDMACSYLSDEWYFEKFNRKVVKSREPWMYKDENNNSQVGGFVKIWDKFVLLTVRGAGHMVPTDKPIPAYHMFEAFIKGNAL